MENATKALIMAGAILIAILLISVGLIVFNSTKGVAEQSGAASETMEVGIYNSQFTKYCGDRVLGSKVNDLQNFVKSYKSANSGKNISVNCDINPIIPSNYYKVQATSYDGNGYVTVITVSSAS